MAAERHLRGRGEPAQLIIGIAVGRHGEGRLAEIVLHGDRLHRLVRKPGVERHDGGRIPGEGAVGKSIDLDKAEFGHSRAPGVRSVSTRGLPGSSTWPSGSTWMSISTPGNSPWSFASTAFIKPADSATVTPGSTTTWNWTKGKKVVWGK